MVSRMYYGVSGYAWGTYRSAKVGQKYQPRALGGVSLQWESGKLTDFDAEYLGDGDLPISQFWICVSHACPLLARRRTGPGALGLSRYGPRGGGCKNRENSHKMLIF